MLIRKRNTQNRVNRSRFETAYDRDITARNIRSSSLSSRARRFEKNEIADDFVEAESRKEFDILCKTMGASDEDLMKESSSYEIIIGRLVSDPVEKGTKAAFTLERENDKCDIVAPGKQGELCLKYLKKGMLVCVEGQTLKAGQVSARRVTFLSSAKSKQERRYARTEKVHKVSSICKASANEGDCPVYTVSCITREHAATKKKYSGEFESLQDAMKVCAQAYNAGVDVCVECDGQPYAKIYTKTKEFEDFTEDSSASKAFRDAMMWSASPSRRKAKNEDDIPTEPIPEDVPMDDTAVDATVPDVNMDIVATESSEEDPHDVRVYAKSHHATVMTESRINGVKMNKMVPGISGKFNGRNRLGK